MFLEGKFDQFKIPLKLLGLLILALFCIPLHTHAEDQTPTTTLNVKITASGAPQSGVTIYAANFQPAYDAISTGVFDQSILSSPTWNTAKDSTGNIKVNGYEVGVNQKHTDSETLTIIRELYKTNFTLLQVINGTNNGSLGAFIGPSNVVQMYVPGSPKKEYTSSEGLAQAKVPVGVAGIIGTRNNQQNVLLTLVKATPDMKEVAVDINQGQGLKISINNLEGNQTSPSMYTVDYGQTIDYQLTVSKDLLTPNGTTQIMLNPSANLVIDSTSIANTKNTLIPPIITTPIPFDPSAGQNQLNQDAQQIGDTYIPQQLFSYGIAVPYSTEDVVIDIKAHIEPTVSLERTVVQQGANSSTPNGINMNIPVNASDSPDYNFELTVNAYPTSGEVDALAPYVNSSGINFVEANSKTNKLVSGGVYALGKKVGNQEYVYNTAHQWQEVSDLNTIDPANLLQLKGGNKYIIGSSEPLTIPSNVARFNFNLEKNTAINQSLIQIFGLGKGENYFLYQLSAPTGYDKDTTLNNFSVFRTYGSTTNGQPLTKSSVGYAENQAPKLNGMIPDYATGINEYNLLSVTAEKSVPFNPVLRIVLPIVILLILLLVVGYLLVKVV